MSKYVDIDGTLLHKDGAPASGLKNFLMYILGNHEVYWLTSYCKGDMEHPEVYLDRYINDPEIIELIQQIEPTNWSALKTETIDFSKPFV